MICGIKQVVFLFFMADHLRKPEAPNWKEIDPIIESYRRSTRLMEYFDRLKSNVRREWKEANSAPPDSPLIALYNAYHGLLMRDLGKLKKAGGDIQKAKELIFHT